MSRALITSLLLCLLSLVLVGCGSTSGKKSLFSQTPPGSNLTPPDYASSRSASPFAAAPSTGVGAVPGNSGLAGGSGFNNSAVPVWNNNAPVAGSSSPIVATPAGGYASNPQPATNYSPWAGGNPWTVSAGSPQTSGGDFWSNTQNFFSKAFGGNNTASNNWPNAPYNANAGTFGSTAPNNWNPGAITASPIGAAPANNNSVAFNSNLPKTGAVISRSGNWVNSTTASPTESSPSIREPAVRSGDMVAVVPIRGMPVNDGTIGILPRVPLNNSWAGVPGYSPNNATASGAPAFNPSPSIPR